MCWFRPWPSRGCTRSSRPRASSRRRRERTERPIVWSSCSTATSSSRSRASARISERAATGAGRTRCSSTACPSRADPARLRRPGDRVGVAVDSVEMQLSRDRPRLRLIAKGTGLAELLGVPDERRGVVPMEVELLLRNQSPGRGVRLTALVPYRKNRTGRATGRFLDRRHRRTEGRFEVGSFRTKGPVEAMRVTTKARGGRAFGDTFQLDESLGPDDTAVTVVMGRVRFEVPMSAVRVRRGKLQVRRRAVEGLRSLTVDMRRRRVTLADRSVPTGSSCAIPDRPASGPSSGSRRPSTCGPPADSCGCGTASNWRCRSGSEAPSRLPAPPTGPVRRTRPFGGAGLRAGIWDSGTRARRTHPADRRDAPHGGGGR